MEGAPGVRRNLRSASKKRFKEKEDQMDLVHDRATIIVEEDIISNLPDEIIHRILSFLDMKYAIQTSTLSKKWKHIWKSMPNLKLNSQTSRTLPLFAKFVNDTLSHRNHRSEVSAVELSFRGAATQFDAVVRSIVNYAYSHNVRKLTIAWFRLNYEVLKFPQRLFRCHTLKHLTLVTHNLIGSRLSLPKSAWDFPALESLNLGNLTLSDYSDKSLNLFSKCVNLKDLTLHQCSMSCLDIFYICAPQLSNLTVTDTYKFPKVFNVVAPQLENLTVSVSDSFSSFLQLSTEGLNDVEKVNLSMQMHYSEKERYAPGIQDLFQKLCCAKFLILDKGIIEVLSACLDQLLDEPCPFNNLKCLKQKNCITMPTQLRNYFLESSPNATFITDLPQVKRSRKEVNKDTMAKKVAKLEEENKMQNEVIAQLKARWDAMKLQHEKLISQTINRKMAELQVQLASGNANYKLICSMGCDIKSVMELTPKSLRVAMEVQFSRQYEEVKRVFLTRIDASQWAKIEMELGITRYSKSYSEVVWAFSRIFY